MTNQITPFESEDDAWGELELTTYINNDGTIIYDGRVEKRLRLAGFDTEILYACIEDNVYDDETGEELIDWKTVRNDYDDIT